MIKFIRKYFKQYWKQGIILVFILIIVQISVIIEPLILRIAVDDILPNGKIQLLLCIITAGILFKLFTSILQRIQQKISSTIGAEIIRKFIVDFYDHIQRLDLSFFSETKMGEFTHRLGQDTYHVYQMIIHGLITMSANIIVLLILFIYSFFLNPILALVFIGILPFYLITQRFSSKLTRTATEVMVSEWANAASFQTEKLSSVRLIKEFSAEDEIKNQFDILNQKASISFKNLELASNLGQLLLNINMYLGPMLILGIGGYFAISGTISVGTLVAFFYFSGKLFSPLNVLINQIVAFQRVKVGIDRINEFYERESKIKESKNAKEFDGNNHSIIFKDVEFSYGREEIFKSLSFEINDLETVGIVGTSGSGKSTIADLIFRFWDVKNGSIKINGTDLQSYSLSSLRKKLGIVSQETILLHDTVENNLKLARNDATIEEIMSACETAGIHNFIMSLPDKYNTILGERGVKISGGQRQRLSIARAILKNPAILILDEATSNLDSETEKQVQNELEKIIKNRTSIIIAHRLSTLSNCNRIFVLDNGRIIESGNHRQLIELEGVYFEMWKKQTEFETINR